jgi:hypothetical protein
MDSHDPVHYAGFAAQCVAPAQLPKFTPESVHLLKSYVSHRDTGRLILMWRDDCGPF